jgi:hypothetical protein
LIELQSAADRARQHHYPDEDALASILPALDVRGPQAIFVYYRMGRIPGTFSFVRNSVVCVDPYSREVITGPVSLASIAPGLPPEGALLGYPPLTTLMMRQFVSSYMRVHELLPRVWHRFLSGQGQLVATDDDVVAFATAWEEVCRPDLRPYYEQLSPDFERWLRSYSNGTPNTPARLH